MKNDESVQVFTLANESSMDTSSVIEKVSKFNGAGSEMLMSEASMMSPQKTPTKTLPPSLKQSQASASKTVYSNNDTELGNVISQSNNLATSTKNLNINMADVSYQSDRMTNAPLETTNLDIQIDILDDIKKNVKQAMQYSVKEYAIQNGHAYFTIELPRGEKVFRRLDHFVKLRQIIAAKWPGFIPLP